MSPPVFRIISTTQQYDWGKIGLQSKVAQLATASKLPDFSLDESAPYAELWMGTHPKSPSRLLSTQELLSAHLASNPHFVGPRVSAQFPNAQPGDLPFLFKVLSIEKALSIQTHPDKKTAEQLFAAQPDIYKDPNHKPEMALALTPFSALCGFLPLPNIAAHLTATPELAALIPSPILTSFLDLASDAGDSDPSLEQKAALKDVFSALMTAPTLDVHSQLARLVARYTTGSADTPADIAALVLRLSSQFPGDVGIFCAFMLNYLHLQPGEAIFLGAGEPHAYIDGDIIECMANSDNVIRAGLTPKLRDVPNLVAGLTYAAAAPARHAVLPVSFPAGGPASTLYDPPIREFAVVRTGLAGPAREAHRAIGGPSVAVVTGGGGGVRWGGGEAGVVQLGTGDVFFVGAGTEVEFWSEDELVLYRAFVEC